jgi:hypothetical protein
MNGGILNVRKIGDLNGKEEKDYLLVVSSDWCGDPFRWVFQLHDDLKALYRGWVADPAAFPIFWFLLHGYRSGALIYGSDI